MKWRNQDQSRAFPELMTPSPLRPLIRLFASALQKMRQVRHSIGPCRKKGVHGIAFAANGNLILVRLTYAAGWRLPGGGRKAGEAGEEAVLRELRQEIGLRRWSTLECAVPFREDAGRDELADTLFILRDVDYRPRRWSIEVEEVGEFPLESLPAGTASVTRTMLRLAGFA